MISLSDAIVVMGITVYSLRACGYHDIKNQLVYFIMLLLKVNLLHSSRKQESLNDGIATM